MIEELLIQNALFVVLSDRTTSQTFGMADNLFFLLLLYEFKLSIHYHIFSL